MSFFRVFHCESASKNEWIYQWNQQLPLFPDCGTEILFPLSLVVYSILVTLPYTISLAVSNSNIRRLISCLYLFKLVLVCISLLLNTICILYIISGTQNFEFHLYVRHASISISLILFIIVMHYERRQNSSSSSVVFYYLLLLNFVWICCCWNHTIDYIKYSYNPFTTNNNTTTTTNVSISNNTLQPNSFEQKKENFLNILDYINLLTAIIIFIVNCNSERRQCIKTNKIVNMKNLHLIEIFTNNTNPNDNEVNNDVEEHLTNQINMNYKDENVELQNLQAKSPENDCSYLSRITYSWFTSLIIKGFRKPLEFRDLWRLDSQHHSVNVSRIFFNNLDRFLVPNKSTNNYLEKRRASMGNSIIHASNNSLDNELRRRSTQSTLGFGIPQLNKHLYKSGLVNPYSDDANIRRASEDICLLNNQTSLQNNTTTNNNDKNSTSGYADNHSNELFQRADSQLDTTVNSIPTSAIKAHPRDQPTRRSVRIRVGPKPEYIPELSELHTDSTNSPQTNENSDFFTKDVDSKSTALLNNPIEQTDNHVTEVKSTTKDDLKNSPESEVIVKSLSPRRFQCFSCICMPKREFGLIYVLFITYGKTLIWSAFLKLIYDILVFVNPALLKLLLNFLQNTDSEPIWHGYLYAIAIFIDTSVQSLILQSYFHVVFNLGMNIKTAITAAVYRKSLRLSNKARYKSTTGQIMNLMSSDAQQFVQLMPFINILWSGPLQITVAMVFLWRELGPSVLAGVGVLLLLLPINVLAARRSKLFQEKKSAFADCRIKFINELMSGIRVLKLYAWEPSFMKEIGRIRDKEVRFLRKFTYLQSISFLWHCSPFFVAIASFGVYILISDKNILDAQKAFVSISLFNILRFPLFMFPMIISNLAQCYVSIGRLTQFLLHTELDMESHSKEDTPGIAAVVECGVFGWDPDEEPTLTNISVQFPEGQLTTIMGTVGSGKSSLLHALLGDMENFNGRVNVKGTVAYVPQQPWIFNATLRDNILFHHAYEPVKYQRVLHACNLIPDLEMLPNGDMTEIGDKGINLSGGQKQRVSLARACYVDADVYLLDDPLSAVDSHVGLHLLKHVLSRSTGILASKTCILTTHSPKALPFSDRVGLIADGQLIELGNYRQLIHSQTSRLSTFLLSALREESEVQLNSPKETVNNSPENLTKDFLQSNSLLPIESSQVSLDRKRSNSETLSAISSNIRHANFTPTRLSQRSNKSSIIVVEEAKLTEEDEEPKSMQQLSQPEKVLTGRIKFKVFFIYAKNIGILCGILVLLFYPTNHLLSLGTNLWLADWSNDATINQQNLTNNTLITLSEINSQSNINLEQFYAQRNYRLLIYGVIGGFQVLFSMLSIYTLAIGHLRCVIRLHSQLLSYVLHAPSTYFDLVPSGRIVNRFSQDIATLDNPVLVTLNSTLNCVLTCFLTLCLACTLNPFMIIPICLLTVIYLLIQNLYVKTSRQLKRLESVSLSPIFSHFTETLSGVDSIRAYKLTEIYKTISSSRQDLNNSAVYASIISQRWLAILLELVGNLVILAVAILSVVARGHLSAGLSGLIITYALGLNQTLNWLVRMFSELEINIVSIERIHEYSTIEQEAPWESDCSYLPSNWPEGKIEFINYSTRYRPELDLALKSINFKVEKGEKLGIVGRTGSGKSSLVLGLFRMLEAAEGEILIDGYDISKLGLHDLRNRLTLIPQDPVLFSGTLRFNLDPFSHYTDDAILHALELANLKSFLKETSDDNTGLDVLISEGGSNISLGQRQLVCLARALLRHTSILVLDEATAAIDMQTDNLIQATIRQEFSSCTVITIAHRLNTVLDYDRILVLEDGEVKELDSPKVLLQNKKSKFYALAKDARIVD
ncbi:Canalicular multispecific organic anion transporter 2 [Schistosoma japonicum]|uniref:Canalicular multispecific organic anion transporter 2 n=1 Tax=Schistosoma japonicum TaxID=6182 RepID=A0A4Z2DPG7_SCHJA|nr:Canalicular multispecific organic anion transporter 2 [Schistosoma japonicum]TNN18413.1 Canalicular multispecific organic anion transporter 2 [Schistosoma japonicum]